jgi:hypothetical protein
MNYGPIHEYRLLNSWTFEFHGGTVEIKELNRPHGDRAESPYLTKITNIPFAMFNLRFLRDGNDIYPLICDLNKIDIEIFHRFNRYNMEEIVRSLFV